MTAALEARNLAKTYETGAAKVLALRGVDLSIERGEFVAIMGPSGCGKTTLLNLLGGVDRPTTGRILIDDQDLTQMNERGLETHRLRRVGFVFQFFNLIPTLTAAENVALPLLLGGQRRGRALVPARAGLARVGLADRASHYPDQLSGGEMQRVAIARALVGEPEAVLCDEPTGNLDTATSREILSLLAGLPEPGRRAVVMVTHDPTAASYGTRIVRIRDGLVESDEPVFDRTR